MKHSELLELKWAKRYIEEGENGTVKDIIFELDSRIRSLKTLSDSIEKRFSDGLMSEDDFLKRWNDVNGRMNELKDLAVCYIPEKWFPRVCVLN